MDFQSIQSLWQQAGFSALIKQCLWVDSSSQQMTLFENQSAIQTYPISTAKNGVGNQLNSFKTPLGFHCIAEKIGQNQPLNMIFKGRQAINEIAQINVPLYTEIDTITTRILWLSGLQQGLNLAAEVDTKNRYIYIHGTADEKNLGKALSHGCIRMKNTDIEDLFDVVDDKTIIYIS